MSVWGQNWRGLLRLLGIDADATPLEFVDSIQPVLVLDDLRHHGAIRQLPTEWCGGPAPLAAGQYSGYEILAGHNGCWVSEVRTLDLGNNALLQFTPAPVNSLPNNRSVAAMLQGSNWANYPLGVFQNSFQIGNNPMPSGTTVTLGSTAVNPAGLSGLFLAFGNPIAHFEGGIYVPPGNAITIFGNTLATPLRMGFKIEEPQDT